MEAFFAAVEAQRQERGLTWTALAAEVNRPFVGKSSIPVSVGTLRGILQKSSVNSAVVLQLLRWLQRTPESFLGGDHSAMESSWHFKEGEPDRILRFDTRSIYEALDTQRKARGLTWRQVADALPGFRAPMLTNLAKGPLIGFPRVMMLTQWLGRPASDFTRFTMK